MPLHRETEPNNCTHTKDYYQIEIIIWNYIDISRNTWIDKTVQLMNTWNSITGQIIKLRYLKIII